MGGRVIRAASGAVPTAETFTSSLPPANGDFVIGVIDTGLLRQNNHVHAWLIDHVNDDEAVADEVSSQGLTDSDGHGTFVAGLILHEAPTAVVEMVRALDDDNDPRELDRFIAGAIRTLIANGVQVINLSFGGQTWESSPPPDIRDALECAGSNGVVITAPAGNVPDGRQVWPAAFAYEFDHVVSVGAVDETATYLHGKPPPRASFSNYGYWVSAFANGVDLLGPFGPFPPSDSRSSDDGWARWSGTSFASATVAGVIARSAIENEISAPEASRRLLQDRRRHLIHETGWAAPVSYVQGVASTWSLEPDQR